MINFYKSLGTDNRYMLLILSHILLGALIFRFPVLAKAFAYLILLIGIYVVIKNKNKNEEVLYVIGYIVGSEVFLRATNAAISYEFGKYSTILFILIGMCYSKTRVIKAWPYWLFLLLLIPSMITTVLHVEIHSIKRHLGFSMLGPISLGVCSIYTFNKKITLPKVQTILLMVGLPVVTLGAYLFLKSPIELLIPRCTESSFEMSGGFGPNQIATSLGLGVFVFVSRSLNSTTKLIGFLNVVVSSYLFYRALLTFSRGGVIVAIAMILLLVFSYLRFNKGVKLKYNLFLLCIGFVCVTGLSIHQTSGLLINRYANQNVNGSENGNHDTGRLSLATKEINDFFNNPVIGSGVGNKFKWENKKKVEIKSTPNKVPKEKLNTPPLVDLNKVFITKPRPQSVSTHNEMTRMLSEHGTFGLIALLILLVVPAGLIYRNKQKVILVCMFLFWFLTINHSATRIAAPSFLYSLVLLVVITKVNQTQVEKD